MSATVYSTSRYGALSEVTATGLHVGTLNYNFTSEQAFAPNHIGCDVGMSIYNDKANATLDGVVAVKATGIVCGISDVITLANTTADGLTPLTTQLQTAPGAGAGLVVTGGTLNRTATGFETGNVEAIYNPLVNTGSPTLLT